MMMRRMMKRKCKMLKLTKINNYRKYAPNTTQFFFGACSDGRNHEPSFRCLRWPDSSRPLTTAVASLPASSSCFCCASCASKCLSSANFYIISASLVAFASRSALTSAGGRRRFEPTLSMLAPAPC